jgi:hypothetical protein
MRLGHTKRTSKKERVFNPKKLLKLVTELLCKILLEVSNTILKFFKQRNLKLGKM